LTRAFVILLQEDKVRKGKKIELPAKKRHIFLMRGIAGFQRHAIQNRSKSKSKPFNA